MDLEKRLGGSVTDGLTVDLDWRDRLACLGYNPGFWMDETVHGTIPTCNHCVFASYIAFEQARIAADSKRRAELHAVEEFRPYLTIVREGG